VIIGEERPECARQGCTEPPEGRSRFCSAACRAAAWRDRYREKPREERDCELCGMPFFPRRGNQRVCDYNSGQADANCKALQDDLIEQWEDEQDERQRTVCEREGCETPTYRPGRGRPKRFCSPRCKTAHYRATKRA
jgi:hypothetical protein